MAWEESGRGTSTSWGAGSSGYPFFGAQTGSSREKMIGAQTLGHTARVGDLQKGLFAPSHLSTPNGWFTFQAKGVRESTPIRGEMMSLSQCPPPPASISFLLRSWPWHCPEPAEIKD